MKEQEKNKNNKNSKKDNSDNIEKHEQNFNNYLSPILDKLSKINYSAINSSMISFANTLSNITTSINPIVDKVATVNYSAISSTMLSFADTLSSVTTSILPIIEKISTTNFSAINNTMLSFVNTLSNINTSISPIIEKIATVNYSAISSSLLSFEQELLKLSINKSDFEKFIENFQNLISSMNIDDLDIEDVSVEDTIQVKTSSLEMIEKIATGTLDYSDVKNNRPLVYSLIMLLAVFNLIIGYIFSKGADYIIDGSNSHSMTEEQSLQSISSINLRIVIADVLNVRKEPSTRSDVVGKLSNFDVVKVINEQPYWFEIEYIDMSDNLTKTGWIAKKYTTDYYDTLGNYLEYFSD